MANWYGTARSNYFRVKDPEIFKATMAKYEVDVWDRDGAFGLGSTEQDSGDWPAYDHDTDESFGFWEKVFPHLQDGEVAVFMSAGAEKMRYITGFALAVTNEGKPVYVDLNDIYELAKSEFDVAHISTATY